MDFREICRKENIDLHVHTKYSKDSFSDPKKIVEFANKHGKIIAITDHNEINGALEAKKIDKENRIIVGEEIRTTDLKIEILAYDIQEKINPGTALNIIEKIHNQGGIAVFSHPARSGYILKKNTKLIPLEIIAEIDGVEVYNARCSREENRKALELARKYGKIETRGSDAHMAWELNLFSYNNIFLNLLKNILTILIKIIRNL